eukprot:CAMPEP_0173299014 /NCGR_PEP_ID=MMETSP1143-20121109/16430_1 /TAXON_ID=483371 /ORGANISM="non described non described, Strain CCMP2298" /LENGTH=53 /DNA_ID=CAMNT_0014239229 /DNA_START=82 /DNA_END=240 /DNA_ORIENTATION=-
MGVRTKTVKKSARIQPQGGTVLSQLSASFPANRVVKMGVRTKTVKKSARIIIE